MSDCTKIFGAGWARFVQVTHSAHKAQWDQHGNASHHAERSAWADQPIAGLITDLKQRGMLLPLLYGRVSLGEPQLFRGQS